jgi:TolA-binding protein
MRRHLLSLAMFIAVLPLGTAYGQMIDSREGIALENQILELKQQIQQMQANGGGNGGSMLGNSQQSAPPATVSGSQGDIIANLLTQQQHDESQMQDLSGRVDTLEHQLTTQHDQMEQEIGDLKFQLQHGGMSANGAGAAQGAQPDGNGGGSSGDTLGTLPAGQQDSSGQNAGSQGASPAPMRPVASIRAAKQALASHDYATAEADSKAILAQGKSSPQGIQAQFVLAQALAGQGRNQDAAIAYDDSYNADRTGAQAPASLLGLANSLTAIHQNRAACDTLDQLQSQFPTPPAGMASRISDARLRAHCS